MESALLILVLCQRGQGGHPKKDVENTLRDAEAAGWTLTAKTSEHRWSVIRCEEAKR